MVVSSGTCLVQHNHDTAPALPETTALVPAMTDPNAEDQRHELPNCETL